MGRVNKQEDEKINTSNAFFSCCRVPDPFGIPFSGCGRAVLFEDDIQVHIPGNKQFYGDASLFGYGNTGNSRFTADDCCCSTRHNKADQEPGEKAETDY